MPNRLQIDSIFLFTSGLITMSSGQGRENPWLSGHVRVASIPTLVPHHRMREAWSRVSVGPVTNYMSRCGSMLASPAAAPA